MAALASCGDKRSNSPSPSDAAAGAGGEAPVDLSPAAGAPVAANPVEEPVVEPYPRTWADSTLTRRLVEGEVSLVGAGFSACTNEIPAPGERWCAFYRLGQAAATELWVVNVTQALTKGPVACDETSEACLRLTSNLWTGSQLWGPMHPYSHRFDGDTLLFHADAPADLREPYEGPVYAWRPGWAAARRISSERGVSCTGHRRSAAVYCIDALEVESDPEAHFLPPKWHSLDLLAGTLDATSEGPLPLVERVALLDADAQAFRAQFTRRGDMLAYANALVGGTRETLRWVSLGDAQPFQPKTVIEDVARWELAHDGLAAYVLRGYSRSTLLGGLALLDFPSGENVRPIASDVSHIDLVGASDDPSSDEDHGLGFDHSTPSGEAFEFIRDRTKLDEIQTTGVDVEGPRVSADGRHSLFFRSAGENWPVATVARNDGSGYCTLNNALLAETYGGSFSQDGRHAFWIEFGRSGSEEGWTADPTSCDQKVKFGDWVLGYLTSDDFVVFDGGDEADSTSFLQYVRLSSTAPSPSLTPLVVEEGPRYPFLTLLDGDDTHIVYTLRGETPERQGLFVHGPLETALP